MDIQYYQNLLNKEMKDYVEATRISSIVVQAVMAKALKNCKSEADVDAYNILLGSLLTFGQQNNMPHFEQLHERFSRALSEHVANGLNTDFPNYSQTTNVSDTGKSPEQIKNMIIIIYNYTNENQIDSEQLSEVAGKLRECEFFLEEFGAQSYNPEDFKKLHSMVGECLSRVAAQEMLVEEFPDKQNVISL